MPGVEVETVANLAEAEPAEAGAAEAVMRAAVVRGAEMWAAAEQVGKVEAVARVAEEASEAAWGV